MRVTLSRWFRMSGPGRYRLRAAYDVAWDTRGTNRGRVVLKEVWNGSLTGGVADRWVGPAGGKAVGRRRAVQARAGGAFWERHGMVLPAAVVVARAEVEQGRAAVKALGLGVEVVGSGGCLVGEVWLGMEE